MDKQYREGNGMKNRLPKMLYKIILILLVGQVLYTIYTILDMADSGYLTGRNQTAAFELISENFFRTAIYCYILLKVRPESLK